MTRRSSYCSGYTLLEVMLVLLITGVLVAAVAAALNIHLRAVETGRAEVEQAQLARALLRQIADDLRAAAPITVDNSGVMSTSGANGGGAISGAGSGTVGGSSSGAGSSSGGSSGGGSSSSANITNITGSTGVTNITGSTGTTSAATAATAPSVSSVGGSGGSGSSSGSSSRSSSGSSTSGKSSSGGSSVGSSGSPSSGAGGTSSSSGGSGASSSTATDSATPADSGEATITPLGIYGGQYDLQIDVSRLPRTDRIDSLTGTIAPSDPSLPADPPSDVKSVAYYISTTAAPGAVSDSTATAQFAGGLVRRQLDRSVVNYSTLYGGAADVGLSEKVLAPEAVSLEFRYFDGTEWLTTWDSSDRKAVPVAVEVYLTLRSVRPEPNTISTLLLASPGLPQEQTYRLLVHLPAGEPSTAGTAELEAAAAESTEAAP